jgi:hypothetical protein
MPATPLRAIAGLGAKQSSRRDPLQERQIRFEADLPLGWRGNSHDPGKLEHGLTSAQRKTFINQVSGRTLK